MAKVKVYELAKELNIGSKEKKNQKKSKKESRKKSVKKQ